MQYIIGKKKEGKFKKLTAKLLYLKKIGVI